jgi:hypothetical protein
MFARCCSDTYSLVWNAGSIVTLFLPLMAFTIARLSNEYNWEEQNGGGQNQQNGYWNNNNYNNYNNPENYNEYGQYVGPTHWWQFWKSNNNNNQQGGQNNNGERRSPWWCKFKRILGEGGNNISFLGKL